MVLALAPRVSTSEQKCVGWPEQKYIGDAGRKAPPSANPDTKGYLPDFYSGCATGISGRSLRDYCSGAFRLLEVDRSRPAQPNNLQGCRALLNHPDRGRCSPRKVEITAPYKGATIVDAHDHGATRRGIGYTKPRAKWQGSAGGSKTMLIKELPRCRPAA